MDEMVTPNGKNWAALFSGMTSGDKTFLGFLSIVGFAYLGKLYFDNVEKTMEHGYDASIISTKNGSIHFKRGATEAEEQVGEEAENANANDNEETVKPYSK